MLFFRCLLIALCGSALIAIASAQMTTTGAGGGPNPFGGGGGGGGTQWSSTDKTSSVVLTTTTTTNDTAEPNSNSFDGVRSKTNTYTGKVYTEMKIIAQAGGFAVVGFCNSTAADVGTQRCGKDDNNGVVLELTLAVLRTNNNTNLHQFNSGGTITTGYTAAFAWDIANHIIWVRINNGSSWAAWDDNGGDDPGTGVGGLTLSTPPTGPFMLYYGDFDSLNQNTIQMKCSSFLGTIPNGFSAC